MRSGHRVSVSSTDSRSADQEPAQQCDLSDDRESLQPERLERIAPLVAQGLMPFPVNLAREAGIRLVCEIQQLKRTQLVRFIASQIARAITSSQKPTINERDQDAQSII